MLAWVALQAAAYNVRTDSEGAAMRWASFPIAYENGVGEELPDAVTGVEDAFDAWAGVEETELVFAGRAALAAPSGAPDRHNVVWVERDWPFEEEQIALTEVWTDEDGEIVAFDIHVNGRVSWATDGRPDAFDMQAAITHEVGHALGLEHSETEGSAMAPSLALGVTAGRELAEDDIEAVRWLYPTLREPRGELRPTACATVASPLGLVAPLVVAAALCRVGR